MRSNQEILEKVVRELAAAGIENPRLDAEVLLAEASAVRRIDVISDNVALTSQTLARFADYVTRRASHEPLAYIVGRREFFSLDFKVTPAVLIPRPETETVVAAALETATDFPNGRALDLGTGSGAIALAIAMNSRLHVVASDISEEALAVARENQTRLHPANRVEFVCCDLFEGFKTAGLFDLVVSNPPYVAIRLENELAPEIRYEPGVALFGGMDGLDYYRRIVTHASRIARPGGWLVMEIGAGQAGSIAALCRQGGGRTIRIHSDLAGAPRALCVQF